jgi:hypothetical protein
MKKINFVYVNLFNLFEKKNKDNVFILQNEYTTIYLVEK